MAATPTRIYVVETRHGGRVLARRLVRGPNQAQVIRHVANESITAEVAGQDDLVELVAAGVKVEACGAPPTADGDPGVSNPDAPGHAGAPDTNPGQEGQHP